MSSLHVSMPTRFDFMPISTCLIGGGGGVEGEGGEGNDDYSNSLGQRIAKRFQIQVFISCNLTDDLLENIREIEPELFKILGEEFGKKEIE